MGIDLLNNFLDIFVLRKLVVFNASFELLLSDALVHMQAVEDALTETSLVVLERDRLSLLGWNLGQFYVELSILLKELAVGPLEKLFVFGFQDLSDRLVCLRIDFKLEYFLVDVFVG